jgi:2-hydroxychromene-2-carboxylate isomerase
MPAPSLDLWFDFASTYTYPAAVRILPIAERAGVAVRFRPFMLGAIFRAQGWDTSPFNLYPAKGRYMWRDVARITAELGLPLIRPEPFPQNGLLAARVAVAAANEPWQPAFSVEVLKAEFGRGAPIASPDVIAAALAGVGADAAFWLERAGSAEVKERLKSETAAAGALGIFGAPSFVAPDGELFWGNDRLEAAIRWAAASGA